MSEFIETTLTGALQALEDRRRRIQPLLDEVRELDKAIREQRKLLAKFGANGKTAQRPPLHAVDGAPARPPREGTNADRILKLLTEHPRGLNTAVIGREADVAAGSLNSVLGDLEAKGLVTKVGRGFWKIADELGQGDAAAAPVG